MATVIVPTKLTHRAGSTSSGKHYVPGEVVLPHYSVTGTTGTVTWSDGGAGGTFNPATGTATDYTPANKTQSVIIQASDSGAGGVDTQALDVTATFPIHPNVDYEVELDNDTKESFARDKSRTTREDGPAQEARRLELLARHKVELVELRAFWLFHRKIISFYYQDVETDLLYIVIFNSGLKKRPKGAQTFDMSVIVKGNVTS